MSTVDAYGPSSQTLTFLDTEDGDLTVGGDTQVLSSVNGKIIENLPKLYIHNYF